MDIVQALQQKNRDSDAHTSLVDVGIVQSVDIPNNRAEVNCSGGDETVRVLMGLILTRDDTVLLLRKRGRVYAIGLLPKSDSLDATGVPGVPPGLPPIGTNYIPALLSSSWRNGWRIEAEVIQGVGGTYPISTGSWFYGSTPKAMFEGYTVTGLQVKLTRATGGVDGPQTVHLYLHSSINRDENSDVTRSLGPIDATLAIGESAWITLPNAWGQAIISSGGGLSISGSPYVILEGTVKNPDSGTLRIDWSR